MKYITDLPWWVRNVYFALGVSFLVWMLFFDRNNSLTTYKINRNLTELENQKAYYEAEIEKVDRLKEELFSSDEKKEKFAREKYLMKKSNEDIFVIYKIKK